MALNLAKAALRSTPSEAESSEPFRFSIASCKRQALNAQLLDRFTAMFDLELTLMQSHLNYQAILNYGVIPA
ncbi:MAG: hypothetical protein HC910_18680 [Spirulinaceae cyanobacterium SM2_1_0]|nr:hypothetical protein [Spirulinaceae cyanobacterium SM2_1_0]